MSPITFALLTLAIGLLMLIPTRRLFLGGWSTGFLTTYFLSMLGLGLLVAELRGPARFLIPVLVLAYIAPFVAFRAGLSRLVGRPGPPRTSGTAARAAPRNVTPPIESIPDPPGPASTGARTGLRGRLGRSGRGDGPAARRDRPAGSGSGRASD
jgi:hypothetical protein